MHHLPALIWLLKDYSINFYTWLTTSFHSETTLMTEIGEEETSEQFLEGLMRGSNFRPMEQKNLPLVYARDQSWEYHGR